MEKAMGGSVEVGLVAGRHAGMPVSDFIFRSISSKEIMQFQNMEHMVEAFLLQKGLVCRNAYGDLEGSGRELKVYVTGLSAATASVLKVCLKYRVPLSLMHYDRADGGYRRQQIMG